MPRTRSVLPAAAVALAAAAGVAGCGGGSDKAAASTPPAKSSAAHTATLAVAGTGLGKVLVNSQGRTLYLFKKDKGTTSACGGACAAAWPPLKVTGKPSIGTGVHASLVGTSKGTGAMTQVTYGGHPLYTYIGDQKAGDTSGQGLNAFGRAWFALTSSGSAASGSPSGTRNGY